MAVLAEVNNTGATAFAQYGGVAALEEGEGFIAEFNARFRRNRDLVMQVLGAHPRVSLLRPAGRLLRLPAHRGLPRRPGLRRAASSPRPRSARPRATPSARATRATCGCASRISTPRLETALLRVREVLDRL